MQCTANGHTWTCLCLCVRLPFVYKFEYFFLHILSLQSLFIFVFFAFRAVVFAGTKHKQQQPQHTRRPQHSSYKIDEIHKKYFPFFIALTSVHHHKYCSMAGSRANALIDSGIQNISEFQRKTTQENKENICTGDRLSKRMRTFGNFN